MRKLFITVAVLGAGMGQSWALSPTPLTPQCCIGTLITEGVGTGCTQLECTYGTTTRYFTNCDSCSDSSRTLQMNGPYKPCGNATTLDSSYGECIKSAIILPTTECEEGSYGKRGFCTPCPEDETKAQTSAKGSTLITDCYIPTGTPFSDDTGTWEYTDDCHYSN